MKKTRSRHYESGPIPCNCGCDQLLTEINYIRDVEMKDLEQKVQESCRIINGLYDLLGCDIDPDCSQIKHAEQFIRDNYIDVVNDSCLPNNDDLPF